ncbi:hypothetical protein BsWGS_08891 [Bradybaena similaris]
MRLWKEAPTWRMAGAQRLKHVNKKVSQNTDTVNVSASAKSGECMPGLMSSNDRKSCVSQQEKTVSEALRLNHASDSSIHPTDDCICFFAGTTQETVRSESNVVKAYAKHSYCNKSSYKCTECNSVQPRTETRQCKIMKTQCDNICFGNVSDNIRLESTKEQDMNKFERTAAIKSRCKPKVDTYWHNNDACSGGGKVAHKFRKPVLKGRTVLLGDNRNNSRHLDDSDGESDEDEEIKGSKADDSKSEDTNMKDSLYEVSKSEGSKSEDSNNEESESGEETRSVTSVTQESYTKSDSESKEGKKIEGGDTVVYTDCDDTRGESNEDAGDTECSIDFENISGSVFWSEEATNDNHITGDGHNYDDNKDMAYSENTLDEEINDFFVRNCPPMSTDYSLKHNSPFFMGFSTDKPVTNNGGKNTNFLNNGQDILERSAIREAVLPILTPNRPSLPLKYISLTSNHFENYKRLFDVFKAKIFSNSENNNEKCDDLNDGACVRKSISIITDSDSTTERSRLLPISSSDSEICKKEQAGNSDRSRHSSVKEAQDTYRTLPAWCDWEADFDYAISDYREAQSPKNHTVPECAYMEDKVNDARAGKVTDRSLRDPRREIKEAKGKHFSSCRKKRDSETSAMHQFYKDNDKKKPKGKGSNKKKLINFKFQGPPKDTRYQYIINAACSMFPDNSSHTEDKVRDGTLHQTSVIHSMAGKSMSQISLEKQAARSARHTKDISSPQEAEDSKATESIPKDTDCGQDLGTRKGTLKTSNREGKRHRINLTAKKQLQPYDKILCDTETQIKSLTDFQTSSEVKHANHEKTTDNVGKGYSAFEARHLLVDTGHPLEKIRKKIHTSENGENKRLPMPECSSNEENTNGSSPEIPRDDINKRTTCHKRQSQPDGYVTYSPDKQVVYITPRKSTLLSKITSRHLRDVVNFTDTRPLRKVKKKSSHRCITSKPTVIKAMSKLSLSSVSSHQIKGVGPKYTVFGPKAHKRRLDASKTGKSRDDGNGQRQRLGKPFSKLRKPSESPSEVRCEKSRSAHSVTTVPGIITKCLMSIRALASNREHKCYLKDDNKSKMTNVGQADSAGMVMDQTATGNEKPPIKKCDNPTGACVDKAMEKDTQSAAENLGLRMFSFSRNDYYSDFRRRRSPRFPDSKSSITSQERSMSSSKDTHSVSDIYFTTKPKRHSSLTRTAEGSPKSAHSLTDIYFLTNRHKYELLEEAFYSDEDPKLSIVDMRSGEGVLSLSESLSSSPDMETDSRDQRDNISNKDILFYDDCLLDLINKRTVTNTANRDTLTGVCRSDEVGSEVGNSVPNLMQPLTISDLLAVSICHPPNQSDLVNMILPKVNLIQEAEHGARIKHQRKRKRAKRKRVKKIQKPLQREPSFEEKEIAENTDNTKNGYDKSTVGQDVMPGARGAQSIVLTVTEGAKFETELVNYENHNMGALRRSDTDHKSILRNSNLESNISWQTNQASNKSEHSSTSESEQIVDNESNSYMVPDKELSLRCAYGLEDQENDGDTYECDPSLKHKLALLLQRIEDTNCIKIVSTQEFYKRKHGAASFLSDLAKMIDHNLEKCNESAKENANKQDVAANESSVPCTPRKASKKENADSQLEEQCAKNTQDCAGERNQLCECRHKQGLFDGHADGEEDNGLAAMGCLARHVTKQISAMNRYAENGDMSLLHQDNTLSAFNAERRPLEEIKKELKTNNATNKEPTRIKRHKPLMFENKETIQLSTEPAAGNGDQNYNTNLVRCEIEDQKVPGNKSQNSEGSKVPTDKAKYNLHNKRMYLDSAGPIKREISYKQSDCNHRDNCKKVNDQYGIYDSDNNTEQVSSKSSSLVSRDAAVSQHQVKADLQNDQFHTSKHTPGGKIRQHLPSNSRPPQTSREPHKDPEDVSRKTKPKTRHKHTIVFLTKNSENKPCREAVEDRSDGKLCSDFTDTGSLKIITSSVKTTAGDGCYWQADVDGNTKVDAQKLDDDYEEYKRHHPFSDALNDNKPKVLKSVGTQFEPSEMAETNHMNTLVGGAICSPNVYYDNKVQLSASGSESDQSTGSPVYQIQHQGTPLFDTDILQVPSGTKCQTISSFVKVDHNKRKKNVTFQEDENRESNKKNSSNKPTDNNEHDGPIDDYGRTPKQQDSRAQNRFYNENVILINSSQQTNSVEPCTNKTQERVERASKSSLYSGDDNDSREIIRPGFVSYIHNKHRRQKAESTPAEELMAISSTETLSSQHSRSKKTMAGNTKGTLTHESPLKNGRYSGASRKESQTDNETHKNHNVPQRMNMANASFRRDTGQRRSPSSERQHTTEDCVKYSIASLNSNDRSEGRVESYADSVNKPLFSLKGSPKPGVEYTIYGKSKPDEQQKKVAPNPRADLESTYVQRCHGGPEVAKKVFEETRSGFRVGLVEPEVAKSGHKFARNEFEVVRGGFEVARNEQNVDSNGLKVTKNAPDMARNERRVARNEHRVARNEFDMARISRELITHPVGRNLPQGGDYTSENTARQTWKMDTLSMTNKVDARKRRPTSPYSLAPTMEREVKASRSVSCHDMRANSLTKESVIQGSDEHLQKHISRYMLNCPAPTILSQKRNYKDLLNDRTHSSEVEIPPSVLPSKPKPSRGNSNESEALVASKSFRAKPKESQIMVSNKTFRGNPRDNDDLLGTREYSSEGFFIPEDDDEDKGNTSYFKALNPLLERFSPELKRRNSLPNYDFPERYHKLHSCSPCQHPMMPPQNLFASTGTRTTWENDQRGVFRPQREETGENVYLENKQQDLQKDFQDYWGERMRIRREEFEKFRQEYRPSLCPAVSTVITSQKENLPGTMPLTIGKMSTNTARSRLDKMPRKTTLHETFKTQRKKAVSEIDTISRKTARPSMTNQAPLRLSDVDVEVHRVDSSTVQRMRSQSKERDIERSGQKLSEFTGKDLFAFAQKTLLGSHFQKERMPSPELTQKQPKSVHESRSPSLFSRIINSFTRSDKLNFMTGNGNETWSGSSQPKESILGADGSGEGFASAADMRGQIAKTSSYSAHIGMHRRNKRRQSHSPQMSLLGLRDLGSNYNHNNNLDAKSHKRQFVKKTNNGSLLSNKNNVRRDLRREATLRKHLDIPMNFPVQSNQLSHIHKKSKESLSYAVETPGLGAIEKESTKSQNYSTKTDCRVAGHITTPLATTGRTLLLLMTTLALSLSLQCDDSLMQLSFRPSLSVSEPSYPSQKKYSGEAQRAYSSTVPVFGNLW